MLQKFLRAIFICSLSACVFTKKQLLKFPDGFEFGSATSAYQAEGAWNVDGKTPSIWDHFVHTHPGSVDDRSTGDVSSNSYYFYKKDVAILKQLGVDNYRFSVSWPRILPNGGADYVNPLGIAHYNMLIDELLDNGITPFVTMYHWDLPQSLQELGGWTNEHIVNWFGDYARVLYINFGDRVKHWITLNEPHVHCILGYGLGYHAPKISSPGIDYYECGRNMLLANARAYRIYEEEFRSAQKGKIGFTISMVWPVPRSRSEDDYQAVLDFIAFEIHHHMDPIFAQNGDYPQRLKDRVADASFRQGLNASRLRPFTKEQIEYMKGSADFLGLNHYTSRIVYRDDSVQGMYEVPSMNDDAGYIAYPDPTWPASLKCWEHEYAPGFYELLMYLKNTYNNPLIYITENGFPTTTGFDDDMRVRYLTKYLNSLLAALSEGANVKGYFAWSLMDSFEWSSGYTIRYGLYEVNMLDPNRTRVPRKSAHVYKEIIRTRTIDSKYTGGAVRNCKISLFLLCLSCFVFGFRVKSLNLFS